MEIDCFVFPGWNPRLRAATTRRAWMDETPESYAYRCLPLGIANAHGWELLSPCGFEAEWHGGPDASDVILTIDEGAAAAEVPVSLFGQGTVTFHVPALFRTPPGWNLWVGGPPNEARDGIAPLSGVIETDWSPYSFTMNWRFTRPGCRVRFEENEPICFLFPVERRAIEAVRPRFRPIDEAPELKAQFEAWSRSRDAFHRAVAADPPTAPADKWQKLYYRGMDANGRVAVGDHQAKLRLREFADPPAAIPARRCPVQSGATPAPQATGGHAALELRRRDWLIETQERMRALSAGEDAIPKRKGLTANAFLDEHYALGRPVVLEGAAAGWPAITRWSTDYLRPRLGGRVVDELSGLAGDLRGEGGAAANPRADAWNSIGNPDAFGLLRSDIGALDVALRPGGAAAEGVLWVERGDAFTPLRHALSNRVRVQIRGRAHIVLASPGETGRLAGLGDRDDVPAAGFDVARLPGAASVRWHRIVLKPGDAFFLPVGWWHQACALEFGVSLDTAGFHWPNDADASYPAA